MQCNTTPLRYCNSRVAVFSPEGKHLHDIRGDWNVVHSLVLYEPEVRARKIGTFNFVQKQHYTILTLISSAQQHITS